MGTAAYSASARRTDPRRSPDTGFASTRLRWPRAPGGTPRSQHVPRSHPAVPILSVMLCPRSSDQVSLLVRWVLFSKVSSSWTPRLVMRCHRYGIRWLPAWPWPLACTGVGGIPVRRGARPRWCAANAEDSVPGRLIRRSARSTRAVSATAGYGSCTQRSVGARISRRPRGRDQHPASACGTWSGGPAAASCSRTGTGRWAGRLPSPGAIPATVPAARAGPHPRRWYDRRPSPCRLARPPRLNTGS